MPRVDRTKNWCRKRLESPKKFDKRSLRTKIIDKDTQLVVGCRKGKYDAKKKRCKEGTRAQSIRKRHKGKACKRII